MPKVSIVIPTYNRARLLRECLESVMEQSFRDFEIIVVDDGSTDNTHEVVSSFPLKYVYQENQGIPAAYNKGIEMSEGEYIFFLDSDDALLKDALRMGVDVLDKHPEVAFSYGQAYVVDEKGNVIGVEKSHSKYSYIRNGQEELRDFLLYGNHFVPSTLMIRRSCLDEVGLFDLAYSSGSEDVELWVRLVKRYNAAYIAEPLAKFREHLGKFSSSRSLDEWLKTNSAILESIFNDTEMGPLLSHLRAKAYFNLYYQIANVACYRGDAKSARNYLSEALKIYPRGLFTGLGMLWLLEFGKSWTPAPVLALARGAKRRLKTAIHHIFSPGSS